jgi:hypothetical protein
MKTSHALKVSSGGRRSGGRGGCGRRECGVFVVGLAGVEAVVQAADESVEQVALGGGGVSVAGGSAWVVVGSGAGRGGQGGERPDLADSGQALVLDPAVHHGQLLPLARVTGAEPA